MTTLILADDHPIVLDGLEKLFAVEPDFRIVARCLNGEEALQAVRRYRPDVLVLDLNMPKVSGLEVLRQLAHEKSPTRVVLLTAELEDDQLMEALQLDVGGVVLKESAPSNLVECVRKVSVGEQWFEEGSANRAVAKLLRRERATRELSQRLSAREIEIIRMVCRGLRNKEIAQQLSITEGTVKIHLHNIYEKLEVGGRMELSLYAREKGIVG